MDNLHAHYHYQTRQCFVWPYDEQARLIGEHLYVDHTTAIVEPIDPAALVTPDRVRAIHAAILDTGI